MSDVTYVVIGAGQAGARAVEALRNEGVDGRVVMIGEERELPYARPELSKGYLAGTRSRGDLCELADDWYARHDVEVMLGCRAVALDPGTQTVRLQDASRVGYDRLLLATGSRPRRLGVPGGRLDGVHYLRSAADADAVRIAIARTEPVVVVGAGWLGLEVAAAAAAAGVEVTLVEVDVAPLAGQVGPEVGARFTDLHRRQGVRVRHHAGVARVIGRQQVEAVELTDGTVVDTPTVIGCLGSRPCTELADRAGLSATRPSSAGPRPSGAGNSSASVADGIPVDGGLGTADPRIWAAGDLALAQNAWFGGPLREPNSASAAEQGTHAGRSMAGHPGTWTSAPYSVSAQYGSTMRHRGVADLATDRLVVRNGEDGSWAAFWLRDGRVSAALQVDCEFGARAIDELVIDRAEVDAAQLADNSVPFLAARVA